MSEIKEIKLSNGHSFLVEVHEADKVISEPVAQANSTAPIMPKGAEATGIGESISKAVDAVTGHISAAVEYVHQEFEKNPPSELTVEFGVDFKGKAAIPVILSGETQAAFKITAKWVKDK